MALQEGTTIILIFMALYYVIKYAFHYLVENDQFEAKVERIPALDAIDDSIDRCVEMGAPVYYTLGDWAALTGRDASAIVAGINIMGYVAEKTAEKRVPMYVAISMGQTYTITMDTVKEGFAKAGRIEDFDPEKILYWSDTWPAYQTGTFHLFDTERPAAYMNIGIAADSAVNTPGYAIIRGINCVSVGACTDRTQVPPMIYGCENWLVAEELFAAGQYVGGTKEAGGGMAGSDVFKVIVAAILVIATVIGLTGTNIIETLFTL
ncbi:MAG: DUF6754 domain-containing protein [Candidatus Hermodarchaeia archaeon]|jgi:hypothetical protein